MRFRGSIAVLAAAAVVVVSATLSQALEVSPMVAKLTPTGAGSSYRLTVRNNSATPATVEIEVYRMQVDESGARSLTPEENDIAVFPVQSVIPANRDQVAQIRYVGDPGAQSGMYLVRVGQLPIDMQTIAGDGEAGADIKVAFTINTYVFVAPASARASVEVTGLDRAPNGDLLLTAHNTGAGFAHLREARFTLTTSDGRAREVPAQSVDVGEVSVMPGGAKRRIRIPAAVIGATDGQVTASIALL